MKVILINPETRTVEFIEIEKGIEAIYKAMDCDIFTCPIYYDNGDALYCDDEGLYKGDDIVGGIIYPNWDYPIVGKCLVLGTDEEGESVDCKSTVEEIERDLQWVSKEKALEWAANFN